MPTLLKRSFFLFLFNLFFATLFAELRLPAIISDNMVLQQKTTVTLWGWADAGENISGKVQAVIQVSPDGVGTLVKTVNGSLMSDPQAKDIIRDWLRKNRFDKTGEESQVIYEFNIRTGG